MNGFSKKKTTTSTCWSSFGDSSSSKPAVFSNSSSFGRGPSQSCWYSERCSMNRIRLVRPPAVLWTRYEHPGTRTPVRYLNFQAISVKKSKTHVKWLHWRNAWGTSGAVKDVSAPRIKTTYSLSKLGSELSTKIGNLLGKVLARSWSRRLRRSAYSVGRIRDGIRPPPLRRRIWRNISENIYLVTIFLVCSERRP